MKNAVIYWSGTGNTQDMATQIAAGMGPDTEIFTVAEFAGNFSDYTKIALGCPSMGDEVLEESEFEPFYTDNESKLRGKKIALFGSYGWGDGQWMRSWCDRANDSGLNVFNEGLIVCGAPSGDECKKYGEEFAAY